jgi:hypothetical protein
MRNWMTMIAVAAAGCGASSSGVCDGVIDVGESCDDGNDDPFDACDCTAEPAWTPPLGVRGDDGLVVLEDDGAWCWFQDERAVFAGDRLVVSTVSHAGDIQVSSFDVATGARDHGVLRRRLERDDHDAASLLLRPDGRLTAFYTRHDGFQSMYWRTQVGDDLTLWDAERELTIDDDITYSNPFLLAGEGSGDPRLFLWFRGIQYSPTVTFSDNLGETWSEPTQVVHSTTLGVAGRTNQRPYVKYASNGRDTIHLIYTEGHPNELGSTSLYHLVYSHGQLQRSDGTVVGSLMTGEDPSLPPDAGTLVHDGTQSTAWVWDVALDRSEQPVFVYAAYDHDHIATYRYAHFDGRAWQTFSIAFAGSPLYPAQQYYAGGISLDPDDTNIVYLSTNVDPVTGAASFAHREIFRGITSDGGATWSFTHVTQGSTVENIRPVVPAHHSMRTAVAWMQGTYQSYLDWNTRIVALLGDADAIVAPVLETKRVVPVAGVKVTTAAREDRLDVTLVGLQPLTAYRVRLHTYQSGDPTLSPAVWTRPSSEVDLCEHNFVGAHRSENDAMGSYVDLDVTANDAGVIALSGMSVDDRAMQMAPLAGVEVFAKPATVPVEGVSVATTSDRPQRSGERAIIGRDRLAIDISGLRPGTTYAITVRTAETTACDKAASRWRLDEAGQAPRVVRSFAMADSTFTFEHVASTTSLRLYASDVEYRLSTNPSEVSLADVVVEEVVP